jgi:hypothetical protein
MGRLIDADKCPCILCEDTRNAHCTYEHRSCAKFCNWLNNTAYDVEKVVAELERKSWKSYSDVARRNLVHLDDAIEIVRKGGVK